MSFIYILKHNTDNDIVVNDLGKSTWISPKPRKGGNELDKLRYLHHTFTEEQIRRSRGIQIAVQSGWFIEHQVSFSLKIKNDEEEIKSLKNDISELKNLILQMANNQPQQVVSEQAPQSKSVPSDSNVDLTILSKIAQDLKEIKNKTVEKKISGYSELTAEDLAIKSKENTPISMIKDEKVEIKEEKVNTNIDDLLNNLGDLD